MSLSTVLGYICSRTVWTSICQRYLCWVIEEKQTGLRWCPSVSTRSTFLETTLAPRGSDDVFSDLPQEVCVYRAFCWFSASELKIDAPWERAHNIQVAVWRCVCISNSRKKILFSLKTEQLCYLLEVVECNQVYFLSYCTELQICSSLYKRLLEYFEYFYFSISFQTTLYLYFI